MPEIGRWSAYIVDIALKIFAFRQSCCFFYNGFMTSGLYDPSLMEGQGTETASAEASPIAHQTELNFHNSRHAAEGFIRRMIISHIRQVIDIVHFLLA